MMTRPRAGVTGALLLCGLGLLTQGAPRAHGAHPSAARAERQAERLIEQGQAALTSGDAATANRLLSEAYRLAPSTQGLYLLGQAALLKGRKPAALDLWRRYLHEAQPDPASDAAKDARLVEVKRLLAEPRGATGEVAVIGEPGALLLVDGEIAGALPLSLPLLLSAGGHELQVELRGQRQKGQVTVTALRPLLVRFQLQPAVVVVTEPELLVLWPELTGLSSARQDALLRHVTQALRRSGFLALPKEQCARGPAPPPGARPEPDACAATDQPVSALCLARLLATCSAPYLMSLRSSTEAGATTLRGALYDDAVGATSATPAATLTRPLPESRAVDQDSADRALATALVQELLQRGRGRARGTLAITSEPPGARLELLSEGVTTPLGAAPYQKPAYAGAYVVRGALPGYASAEAQGAVPASGEGRLELRLLPLTPGAPGVTSPAALLTPAPPRRPRWRVGLGAGLVAGGALLGGFGVGALLVDQSCIGGGVPEVTSGATRICANLYQTRGLGLSLTTVGLVSAGVGAVLWALPPRKRPPSR